MKTYSIGREQGCQIVISDHSDVVSRRHATLTVLSATKMTITDLSSNGTYVNGIRISKNVPVPVTRKDTISFAHVAVLDWNMVPKEKNYLLIAMCSLAGLVFAGLLVWGALTLFRGESKSEVSGPEVPAAVSDTTAVDTTKKATDRLKEIEDSLKNAKQQEKSKVNKDKTVKERKQEPSKKETKKEDVKKEEPSAKPIG